MDGLLDALKAVWALLWEILKALSSALWWLLRTYPELRAVLVIAAVGFGIFWFIHGLVRKWKPCPKGGRNTSKRVFKGTWSDRSCCNGSGRHLRVPARIWNRFHP